MKHKRWLALAVLATLSVGYGRIASAQDSKVPERSQFLLIIDDSGSMRNGRKPGTDPDRLAVLSARMFLSLLGDNDRVAVYGMNELAHLKRPASVPMLEPNVAEQLAETLLDPNGKTLAMYSGKETPCKGALASASEILNKWYDPQQNARQVVLFLTDGRCEVNGKIQEPEQAELWLQSVESWSDGLFQFDLLNFEGNSLTEELKSYASKSGGLSKPILKKGRLKEIAAAFSNVFAGAQGYATVPDPHSTARSYSNAERIRVLAVRKVGADPVPLSLRLTAKSGVAPEMEACVAIPFQHVGSDKYEWCSVEITPNKTPFSIVEGGNPEVLLLIPDYRGLHAELRVRPTECLNGDEGLELEVDAHAIAQGTQACVQVVLRAGNNSILDRTNDLDYAATYSRRGGVEDEEWLSMKPRPDGFSSILSAGREKETFTLRAKIVIAGASDRPLYSAPEPLTVIVRQLEIKAVVHDRVMDSIKLETVHAGDMVPLQLLFKGEFDEKLPVSIELNEDASHECFDLKQKIDKGMVVTVSPGQTLDFRITSRKCRSGGKLVGKLIVTVPKDSGLHSQDMGFEITFLPTPWWQYWGPLVIKILAGLFALMTLACIIKGFRIASRRLPERQQQNHYYYAYAHSAVYKNDAVEFRVRTQEYGAFPLTHDPEYVRPGGWYRNAQMRLASDSKARWTGPDLLIEFNRRGHAHICVPEGKTPPEVHEVRPGTSLNSLKKSQDGYRAQDFGAARPTLVVSKPCFWYARLFGRLPNVRAASIQLDTWYRVGGESATSFFKIDKTPHSEGE